MQSSAPPAWWDVGVVPFCLVLPASKYGLCADLGLGPNSISYFIVSADGAGLDLLEWEQSQEPKRKEGIAVSTRHKHNPVLHTRESTQSQCCFSQ